MIKNVSFFQLYEAFPGIMKHLPGKHNDMFSNYKLLYAFVREIVIKHKAELDPSEPRDYIDSFLIEMMEVIQLLRWQDDYKPV